MDIRALVNKIIELLPTKYLPNIRIHHPKRIQEQGRWHTPPFRTTFRGVLQTGSSKNHRDRVNCL